MESSAVTVEVDPGELGERLASVRLLKTADEAMMASLRRHGQLSPLLVFRGAERLEVLDGFRRLRAARSQAYPERLLVRVLALDERAALAALFALHRAESGLSELEEGWIVRALVREQGLSQAEVAQRLRRDPSWVSRRLLLVEMLSPEVQEDVRLGLLGATSAREVARLPRGTQAEVARIIAARGLTSRQVAQLCALVLQRRASSPEQLERLALELGAPAAATRSVPDGYRIDLAQLERVASRLRARLLSQPPAEDSVRSALRAVAPMLRALADQVESLEEKS